MSQAKPAIEEIFSQEISKTFSTKRIVSLLYFGTRAFGLNTDENSDYDFMLVLDKYKPADALKLREIVQKKIFSRVTFDLNLLYLADIKTRGLSNFQIRAMSLPFYMYLENARLLIGKNIFRNKPVRLNKRVIKKVNSFRIQEFYGRCDMLYFKSGSEEKLFIQLRKYTKDILWFILNILGIIEIKDLTLIPFEKMLVLAKDNKILSVAVYKKFLNLLKRGYSPSNLTELEKIRRTLYEKYLLLYKTDKPI